MSTTTHGSKWPVTASGLSQNVTTPPIEFTLEPVESTQTATIISDGRKDTWVRITPEGYKFEPSFVKDADGLKYAYEQAVKKHPEELTAKVPSTGDPTDDPTDYGDTDVWKGLLNGTRKYWTSPWEQIYWERQK